MEPETSVSNNIPVVFHRLFHAFFPALLISIGYVDPGKWAASVEGGARFGFDLLAAMLVFNFAAILCQYLSARIGVVTGRALAEACISLSLSLSMSVLLFSVIENACQFYRTLFLLPVSVSF